MLQNVKTMLQLLALMFQEVVFLVFRGEIAWYIEDFLLKMKSGSAIRIIRFFLNYSTLARVAGL